MGALSIIDRRRRAYDPDMAAALEDLAALVAQEWERRRAVRALKASEAKARAANVVLERVIDSAPVALLMTDRKLRVLQSQLPLAHRDRTRCDSEIQRPQHLRFLSRLARELGPLPRPGADGRDHARTPRPADVAEREQSWMRVEITPWRNRDGGIGGLLVMSHDLTDMVEALETMRRSEQTLKLALEIGELSMWELDHRGRRVNGAGAPVVQAGADRGYEDLSRDIWYGVHPADRPAAMAAWERYEQLGEPFRATFRMMQRDAPHVWVQSATELVRDEDGHVERTVGVLRNIDKEKRAEIALAKARRRPRRPTAPSAEFLANMSHEIRTPLNGVMGVASALARTALDPSQREMVRADRELRQDAGEPAFRRARPCAGRIGRARAGQRAVRPGALHRRRRRPLPAERRGQEPRPDRRAIARCRGRVPGRRGAGAADPLQPGRQRREVHAGRRGEDRRFGAAHPGRDRRDDLGQGHRHRLRRRDQGAAVRPFRAGRRLDHPALRRHRARARHLALAGRADGRGAGRQRRARQGRGLHSGAAADARGEAALPRRRRWRRPSRPAPTTGR